jgi:formate C-acetyltransferase
MNQRTQNLREAVRDGYYRRFRRALSSAEIARDLDARAEGLGLNARGRLVYEYILEREAPLVFPGERIIFTRTIEGNPEFPMAGLEGTRHTDVIENLTPEWPLLLKEGLLGRKAACQKALAEKRDDPEAVDFLTNAIAAIDAAASFAKRYAEAAEEPLQRALLEKVPLSPAENFHEALQSLRFVSSVIRLAGGQHIGFGRFDQYMWPYLKKDLETGVLTQEEAFELLEEFFISLSRDADLYKGVQLGDNGQSLMLGGCDRSGKPAVNPLTYMCLEASEDIGLIDPKINLRIDSNTPDDLLMAAAKLTRRGLGFPQYSNDEVVIDSLVRFGYDLEAARNYTVAACWEFVVEDGRDTPNIFAMNFPLAADRAIRSGLKAGDDFDGIMKRLEEAFEEQAAGFRRVCEREWYFLPDPFISLFSKNTLAKGRDLNNGGGSHYHYGCHGCGSANAADALAAVKYLIFEKKQVSPARLLAALESDYENDEELRQMIKDVPHKVGNNDDYADSLLKRLFEIFADTLSKIEDNGRGGRIRPGTGSAQHYVLMTEKKEGQKLKATADGRKYGDFIGSSLAPSPGVKVRGVISELETYGKIDYGPVCNGGPITLELADAYFRNEEALQKVVKLIQSFVKLGCQQLQLNTLNPDKLRDAQIHPENYRDLIVRVWGWSGYFVELSKPYQDQIIGRQAFGA